MNGDIPGCVGEHKLGMALGFSDCAPYYDNAGIGSQCMETALRAVKCEK